MSGNEEAQGTDWVRIGVVVAILAMIGTWLALSWFVEAIKTVWNFIQWLVTALWMLLFHNTAEVPVYVLILALAGMMVLGAVAGVSWKSASINEAHKHAFTGDANDDGAVPPRHAAEQAAAPVQIDPSQWDIVDQRVFRNVAARMRPQRAAEIANAVGEPELIVTDALFRLQDLELVTSGVIQWSITRKGIQFAAGNKAFFKL